MLWLWRVPGNFFWFVRIWRFVAIFPWLGSFTGRGAFSMTLRTNTSERASLLQNCELQDSRWEFANRLQLHERSAAQHSLSQNPGAALHSQLLRLQTQYTQNLFWSRLALLSFGRRCLVAERKLYICAEHVPMCARLHHVSQTLGCFLHMI